jgi:hypothetical protein
MLGAMKLNLKALALAAVLTAGSAHAQGIIQFNWHGDQNLFQASFQVYDYEMTPGTWFSGTHLYEQTVVVTGPDHTWNTSGTGGGYASRFVSPGNLYLDLICRDPAFPGVEVDFTGSGIFEMDTAGIRFSEGGSWTTSPIPEPSCGAILVLGLLALYARSRP